MLADIVDFTFPRPAAHRWNGGIWRNMRTPFWTTYYEEKIRGVFAKKGLIVDIGGGLRIDDKRGDKLNAELQRKCMMYVEDPAIDFKVTDYTDQYSPDLVEDIHALSFPDNTLDGLFCMAVLEHVYDPKKGAEEIVRVLKPGAQALLYVPFIYRYHANVTEDYRDYFRFSIDGIGYLFRECSSIEVCPVRGIFESLLRFTPLHRFAPLVMILRLIDWSPPIRAISEKQSSGYFISLRK